MREENIQLAIKSITALILQKYPDLTGGEKLKNIAMGKIENIEGTLEDSATEKEKEFIIREAFANCSRKMEDGIGLFNPSTFNPWYNDRKGKIKNLYWDDYKLHLKVNENWNDKDQWKKINLTRDGYSSRKRTGHGDENLRCSGSRWTKDTSGRSARKK